MMKKLFLLFFLTVVLSGGAMAQGFLETLFRPLVEEYKKNRCYAHPYSSSKLLSDEEDYVVYEDSFSEPIEGSTFCQNTGKLYLLEGSRTIVEYDIDAVKRGKEAKRVIKLSFNVERRPISNVVQDVKDPYNGRYIAYGGGLIPVEREPRATVDHVPSVVEQVANAIVEVSPDGKYLALMEENNKKLHVIDILSGNETRSIKLGKEYDNYLSISTSIFTSPQQYKPVGCPFAFQSNNEILVTGNKSFLLYNIETKKKKNFCDIKKEFGLRYNPDPTVTIKCVTPNGYVFLMHCQLKLRPDLKKGYERDCGFFEASQTFDENEYISYEEIWDNDLKELSVVTWYYDRRTGEKLSHHWADSKNQYVFRGYLCDVNGKKVLSPAIRAINNDSIYLVFPMNDTNWKASFLTGPIGEGYFYIYGEKKLRIFNHNLTSNEIEKAIIRYIIKDLDRINNFISNHPNSIYKEFAPQNNVLDCLNKFISDYPSSIYKVFAQQNIDRIITEKWDTVSKPSNYTLDHFKEVEQFISEHASYGNVQMARDELANIYKGAYESLGDNDRRGIDQYIINYPKSPYIDQAKQKQRQLYAPGYEAVCKENSLYRYRDYVRTYPNSPYRYEVERRIRGIEEREREEALAEQRRKEAAALAEQQRKEAAALAEKQRQEEAALAEKKRKEAAALAEKQRQEAEKKRKEEEQIAEQKRKEAERERQIAANSKVSTWKLGNKICNCQKNHVMVILDSWNENKTSFKGQILTSDVSYFEGQNMKKGSIVWFDTKGWHKCLEDEIAYCTNHDISNSSAEVSSGSSSKKDPPYKRGMELHCSWSYTYKEWVFAREKTGLVYLSGVIEDWNEDYSRVKIRITYYSDSGYNNSGKKYYVGSIHWEDPSFWKP